VSTVVIIVGVALVAGFAGYELGLSRVPGRSPVQKQPTLPSPFPPNRPAPSQAAPPPSAPTRTTSDPEPNRNLPLLRALGDLQKRNLANVNFPLIDWDGKLTQQFRELFGLTEAEAQSLQETVAQVRAELDRRRNQNTTVKATGDAVEMKTVAFAGADLYDRLEDQLSATLGSERYALFMSLQENQLQWPFGQFGAQDRTVSVTRMPQSDGTSLFSAREDTRGAAGSSNGSATYRTVAEVVKHYPTLAPYAEQIAQLPTNPKAN